MNRTCSFLNKFLHALSCVILLTTFSFCSDEPRSPKSVIEIAIKKEDINSFKDIIYKFAEVENFKLENLRNKFPKEKEYIIVFFVLTREDGLQLTVTDLQDNKQFHVYIYDIKGNDNWKEISSKLASSLEEKWPGEVKVTINS